MDAPAPTGQRQALRPGILLPLVSGCRGVVLGAALDLGGLLAIGPELRERLVGRSGGQPPTVTARPLPGMAPANAPPLMPTALPSPTPRAIELTATAARYATVTRLSTEAQAACQELGRV